MTVPLGHPLPHPSLAQLGRDLHHICAHATQAEEIAAALEANGMNDDIARERYGLADVFACAEALFSHLPYRDPVPAAPRRTGTAWALAPRGVLYALPGAALTVAGALLAAAPGAQTALLVSVVFGWGWGQGLACLGYRKSGAPLRRFLGRATLCSAPVSAAVSAGVALATGEPPGTAALVGAVAGVAFAAFAALLILGRLLLAGLVYLPSLVCLLVGGGGSPAGAWLALACAALLPLLVFAERTPPAGGLQLPPPPWAVPLAHAASGWSCALFVTLVFGAALWERLGAAALLPVIVSVGAMEVLSLTFHARLRALARHHGDLGRLARTALGVLLLVLALYLLVLAALLGLYLGLTQPGGWRGLPAASLLALPLLLYGGALLLGTVVSNAGQPWVTCGAWLLGALAWVPAQLTQPHLAPLLGSLAVLVVLAPGVARVLLVPTTYR